MTQRMNCRRCQTRMEIRLQSILAGEAPAYCLRIVKNCEENYAACRIRELDFGCCYWGLNEIPRAMDPSPALIFALRFGTWMAGEFRCMLARPGR